MSSDPIMDALQTAAGAQGRILARLDSIESNWRDDRSIMMKRLEMLESAERKHSDIVIEWRPHVDRIKGATDATLAKLGQAALIVVIVVAALVGGGALLPRLITNPPAAAVPMVGGP